MSGPRAALPLDPGQLHQPLAVPPPPELRGGDAPRDPLPLLPHARVQAREHLLPVRRRQMPLQLRRTPLERLDPPRRVRPDLGAEGLGLLPGCLHAQRLASPLLREGERHPLRRSGGLRRRARRRHRPRGARAGPSAPHHHLAHPPLRTRRIQSDNLGSTGAPSSHTRPPSVSTQPSPGCGSDASRPSSPTVAPAATRRGPTHQCVPRTGHPATATRRRGPRAPYRVGASGPAARPAARTACRTQPRTVGTAPRTRRRAPSRTSRPRCSSFSSCRSRRRKTRVRRTGHSRKRGRRSEGLTLSPPPLFDCCVRQKIAHFASLPSQIVQAVWEEVPLPLP